MDYNNKLVIGSLVAAIIILAGVGFLILRSPESENLPPTTLVANFDDCAKAGYPIMESYPRQCRTPDGKLYVEAASNSNPPLGAVASGGCFIGGCSSQICSDQRDAVSTCEYREEYACYKTGRCERQSSGRCGWTQTPELTTCINAVLDMGVDMK